MEPVRLFAEFRRRRFPVVLRSDPDVRANGKEFCEAISGPVSFVVPILIAHPWPLPSADWTAVNRLEDRLKRAGYINVRLLRVTKRKAKVT